MPKLPHPAAKARKILEDRVCQLFSEGKDTMYIASAVNLSEAQVYNILARLS